MKMSLSRKNMMDVASDVLIGNRKGNKKAAAIALDLAIWVETRDLILGETTSDAQLNAEIAKVVSETSAKD
jgi:hypothetical protein